MPEPFQMVPPPDAFACTQVIREVYVPQGSSLRLIARPGCDDRTLARKRQKAAGILGGSLITFGALHAGQAVGFLTLNPRLQSGQMVVESFHISRPFRRRGLSRRLFACALRQARQTGAKALYLSAANARKTVDFYRAPGCTPAGRTLPGRYPFPAIKKAECSGTPFFHLLFEISRQPGMGQTYSCRLPLNDSATTRNTATPCSMASVKVNSRPA